jgi:alkylation response protein AidB-like acyl-CoA dehydrogenase
MSEMRTILGDTVEKLFAEVLDRKCREDAEAGEFPQALWTAVEENGLTMALVPEDMGGTALSFEDTQVIIRSAGRHAVPIPLADCILANGLMAKAGITPPVGVTCLAPVRRKDIITVDGEDVSGTAGRVPWGRNADHVLVAVGETLYLIPKDQFQIEENQNLATEPRDSLRFQNAKAVTKGVLPDQDASTVLYQHGAMFRAGQIAGALEAALEMAVQYANDRTQFGRPISKFQAIQQSLAVQAGNTAASVAAATAAFKAADGDDPLFEIQVAKARTSEAVGGATSIAHQTHGAIGFTYEHDLHFLTRRLWSWRDEFGGSAYWSEAIGRDVAARGGDELWSYLTKR